MPEMNSYRAPRWMGAMSELVQIGAGSKGNVRPEPGIPRPEWLRIRIETPERYKEVKQLVEKLNLHTVCKEARCPNIYECWGKHGTATLMILGDICTRRCGFCAVTSGRPNPGVDPHEPENVAKAVAAMQLRHAVITSVDRDDLPDGGAAHWAAVIAAIHRVNPETAVEVLTPTSERCPTRSTWRLGRGRKSSRTTWRRCRGCPARPGPAAATTRSLAPPGRRRAAGAATGEYQGGSRPA